MEIGDRIRKARERLCMKQSTLSRMTGISRPKISRYERNVVIPPAIVIFKIADALGVSVESLTGEQPINDQKDWRKNMDTNSTISTLGINFGTGPVGYQEGTSEKQIKELVEKIEEETKAAGLPWWASIFNPEIFKLAELKRGECNCAEQKDPVTALGEKNIREKIEKLKEENAVLRDERNNRQIELYNRANEKCMTALEAMEAGMEKLQTSVVENDLTFEQLGDLTEKLAKLGSSISMVRMSMGLQIPPYVMGINSGFCAPDND